MKRALACLLVLGLVAASPIALAQSEYDPYDDASVPADVGAVVDSEGSYYDYARVIRVDPVLEEDYAEVPDRVRRCHDRTTAGRYGREPYADARDPYDDRDPYAGRDPDYDRDPYARRDPYYDRDPYAGDHPGTRAGSNAAAVIGGIAGAVLGSKVGSGSGSYAAAAVGSMLGSMAGREIYEQHQRELREHSGIVRVCDPIPVRDDGDALAPSRGGYDVTYEYNGRQYTRRMDYNPGDRIRVRVDITPE